VRCGDQRRIDEAAVMNGVPDRQDGDPGHEDQSSSTHGQTGNP
jgi:hypothetical protein